MNAWVTMYRDSGGEVHLHVWASEDAAVAWKNKIGEEMWEEQLPEHDKPKQNVGKHYFNFCLDEGIEEEFIMVEREILTSPT